jgi:hypothetical protein
MPREMSPAMLSAIAAQSLQPAIFLTATFVSGPVYLWTGYSPIVWNGNTWLGIGDLGSITPIEEGSTIEAKGLTISLNGFDATLLGHVLDEFLLGAPVVIYLGLFSGGALLDSPICCWAGRMDQPTIDVDGTTATISINCENRLLDMNVTVDKRYTPQQAQQDNPGDAGFQFVAGIAEALVYFGSIPSNSNNL